MSSFPTPTQETSARNRSGEYLLFMTQDACPSGPYWLRGMLRPVLQQGVTVVSCREEPRLCCDLLGLVNIFIHYSYLEVHSSDRIMQMPEDVNIETLRKNVQLSDLACLIRKDVFEQDRHRRNYTEDLYEPYIRETYYIHRFLNSSAIPYEI